MRLGPTLQHTISPQKEVFSPAYLDIFVNQDPDFGHHNTQLSILPDYLLSAKHHPAIDMGILSASRVPTLGLLSTWDLITTFC